MEGCSTGIALQPDDLRCLPNDNGGDEIVPSGVEKKMML
jgi:hypothetical protein